MPPALVELEDVGKSYSLAGGHRVEALRGVGLSIAPGEFLALVGPSGSGKSTLLNLIGCLDKASRGRLRFDGEDVGAKSPRELAGLRNAKIGFVFQTFNLIPVLDVCENIEFPFLVADRVPPRLRRQRVEDLVRQLGLWEVRHHRANQLSGGQMQRVAIGRALALDPKIVLADEPTANLDSRISESILELMRGINAARGTTFLFATHDPLVLRHMKRRLRLHDGQLREEDHGPEPLEG